jgi:LysM repeat protein
MRIEGPSIPPTPSGDQQKYLTQDGDTLRQIATKFTVDPEALKNLNNIKASLDDKLQAGREVLIPAGDPKGQQGGDSSIAGVVERVGDKNFNPFVDPSVIGASWSDTSPPGPDPYCNPTWWEVEPPWMQAASFGDDVINPDPTKVILPDASKKKTEG